MATVGTDTGNQVSADSFEHRTPRDYEGIRFFSVFSKWVHGCIAVDFSYLARFARKGRLIALNVVAGYQDAIGGGDIAWFEV